MARDDFHKPKPRKAPVKAVVNGVLSAVSAMGTSLVSLLSGLLAAVLILYSGYVLYDTFYTQENAKSGWDLLQYKPVILEDVPAPEAGENRLAKINSDYRAWLTLYETNIDYPVMQGDNDLYYANHDIYKEVSLTGAIYLAAGNNGSITDSYNLIYGHHMDNGAMFGALDLFRDQSYFNAHREGLLVSRSAVYDLYAFAVAETDAYQNRIYAVGDRMDDLLTFLLANLTDADPDEADWSRDTTVPIFDEAPLDGATKIVALSTCAAANTNGRLVVFYVATLRNLITVNAQGSTWVYDGQAHTLQDLSDDGSGVYFTTNYPGDDQYPTTVEYSIDGGITWTTTPPWITNVSESTDVIVRVTNDAYGRATTTVRLQANPRPVTVTADPNQQKIYGQGDPVLTATVVGTVGNETVSYTVTRPGAGEDENVGVYTDAIIPSGDAFQGNYTVTYVPADFTILPAPTLRVSATGYVGVYDGETHRVSATVNLPDGTVIEYSIDGGQTWTTTPPSLRDVGDESVQVRATNPNYQTSTVTVPLRVKPRPVTVRANPAGKIVGANDPTLTATVTGLLGRDRITYTVTRPGAGTDETVGVYQDAIVPAGEARQGNYIVTYVPADFTITAAEQLILTVTDYTGVYDAESHQVTATVNIPAYTRIEYSVDGGQTWTTKPPSIINVGSQQVLVRATNPGYETVTATYTLTVTPAPVTVTVHDSGKVYGQDDPETFETTVTGLLGEDTVTYAVSRPNAPEQQSVGLYPGAIVAEGEELQGNYIVTYVPGNFEIVPAPGLTLRAEGFTGVYDGEEHAVIAEATTGDPTDDKNTVIEYSVDGGQTWATTPPSVRDVAEVPVLVRATNPNYDTVEVTVLLRITPRIVTVTVGDYSKLSGSDDPEFTATVDGLLEGDEIRFTIVREEGEAPGTYAITPTGDEIQGNYQVVYHSGRLRIINNPAKPTPTPGPTPVVDEPKPDEPEPDPLVIFDPRGTGRAVWALVNLICLIITIYLFFPLLHLDAKFDRPRKMKKINKCKRQLRLLEEIPPEEVRDKSRLLQLVMEAREKKAASGKAAATGDAQEDEFGTAVETLFYQVKRFLRRFRIGMVLELIFSALALVAFILTEDMRLPMVLIDRWTPLMILLMLIVWVLDVRLIRYRGQVLADEEEAERKRLEREQEAAQ